jgi:hypothetical protein
MHTDKPAIGEHHRFYLRSSAFIAARYAFRPAEHENQNPILAADERG